MAAPKLNRIASRRTRVLAPLLGLLVAAALPIATAEASSGGVGGGTPVGGGSSSGDIEGLSPSYAKFSELVAANTDLSLRVVGAWTLAEGGPKDNPLNIGPGHHYGTVNGGARATTELLSDSRYAMVMNSTSKPDLKQIRAIARSPWCPGCAGYERLLRRTYTSVDVEP